MKFDTRLAVDTGDGAVPNLRLVGGMRAELETVGGVEGLAGEDAVQPAQTDLPDRC